MHTANENIMHQGICKLSITPIRAEPNGKSELLTQLLFGETYVILEQQDDWLKIKTDSDNYLGWMNQNQFYEYTDSCSEMQIAKKFPMLASLNLLSNTQVYLLPGSVMHRYEPAADGAFFYVNNDKFFVPIVAADIQNIDATNLEAYALQFLNCPYLWGGKTMLGMDCSGFTQILYKTMGIQIPRDAHQQAEVGEIVTFSNEARLGDLAFFENEQGAIIHVGLILRPGEILHASGKVRCDMLDSYGIYNSTYCKHTHKLRFIKRILR
ncbi:MAG: C40 family peptidase [Bacteroidota bacterium]|nr:C40 family peptidase [Bacteroidota bacterium]